MPAVAEERKVLVLRLRGLGLKVRKVWAAEDQGLTTLYCFVTTTGQARYARVGLNDSSQLVVSEQGEGWPVE